MGIRLGSTVINCADMGLMTRFWSQALGLVPSSTAEDDDFRVLRGDRVNLSLQRSRTPVTARDQMHLDLFSDDQAAEVERLTGLGATFVRHHDDPDDDYVVMTDPEGNEFCVVAVASLVNASGCHRLLAPLPGPGPPRYVRAAAAPRRRGSRSRRSGSACRPARRCAPGRSPG